MPDTPEVTELTDAERLARVLRLLVGPRTEAETRELTDHVAAIEAAAAPAPKRAKATE